MLFAQSSLSEAYSQIANVTIQRKDITVKEVLTIIERNSQVVFFYADKDIDLNRKVSIDVKNQPVSKVLEELFKNSLNTFKIDGKQVYISKKTKIAELESKPEISTQTITGVISDDDQKEPLIGVSVSVKGTKTGTITDINGKYSIKVSAKDILVFTYIGMEKKEVMVLNNRVINVTLQSNSTQLSEVVAIGYGSVKKTDLTGSVAVISAKELTRNPSSSAAQSLQGRAPGVLVFQNGAPGGGATIRVRGVGSISKGSDPIYIVDGVQIGNINGIQPQEIENMQVLKDASASAIYGANGSNGVIIVTTKRGKAGKVQVNLDTYVGVNLESEQYDIMNADQYAAFYNDVYTNYKKRAVPLGYQPAFREKYYGVGWKQGTNWQDQMFKTGLNQNYHLSLAGGGENSNFSVSMGYVNEDGTVIKTNAERYTLRINSDFKLGKQIKIGENVSLSYNKGQSPMTWQSGIYDLNASPLMKIYNPYYKGGFESCNSVFWEDADGNLQQGAYPGTSIPVLLSNTEGNDKPNPLAAPLLGDNRNYILGTRTSVYMQIDFTNWLVYKVTPTAEINSGRSRAWLPKFTGNRAPGDASLVEGYYENITLNLENQLTFSKKFNDIHNVQATAVYQVRAVTNNNISGTANGFDFEQLNTLTNGNSKNATGGTSDSRMLSYLGRIMYDYKGKYFATGSFRSDGISVFAPGFRRGNFASASVAWKLNEDFFKNVKEIDALKLRLGWGQTGNSNIGGGFQYYDHITSALQFSPVFGTDQHISPAQYVFNGMGSPEIHWESAEMYNLGIDLNMFNNKLQASAEYYVKNNNDLLVQIPITSVLGRGGAGNPWYNTGNIQNRGVELSLQWRDYIGKFNYGIISNFSTIKNEVLSLPVSDITKGTNRTIVGHSIGALYGFISEGIIQLDETNYIKSVDGNWQKEKINNVETGNYLGYKHAMLGTTNTPQPGDIRFADLNGDGNITDLDRTIIGKTIPSFNYSIGFDCSFKSYDFNIFLYGVGDFQIYNQQRANLSSMNAQDMDHNKLNSFAQNHWTLENASTTYVRIDPTDINVNERLSTFWIENGSFLRIKDVQFGYTLPKNSCSRLGVASIRIYANASNLYCFTAYKGRDPEGFISNNPLSGGSDNGGYTMPHSFTGGVQIGF